MALLLVSLTLFATTLGAMSSAACQPVAAGDEVLRHIWLTIRLPRVLLALLVGAALALSGCVMQGLFRNVGRSGPAGGQQRRGAGGGLLAGPAVVGSGAGGAVCPDAGGVYREYRGHGGHFYPQPGGEVRSRLLLVGIAINALCGALVGVLAWISNDTQLRQLSLWGMGSLGQAEWPTLLVAAT
jgi:iron complex transport system permease protein